MIWMDKNTLYNPDHAKPEDSNEFYQKLLEDLKDLAEYDNSPSKDHPIFNNDDEHSDQNKEHLENSSNEIAASNSNQEKEKPPQDFDIRKLIREECCVEEQKLKIEDTILELVEICRQKELLCMHDNVDDLIKSALNSKLLSINSQRLNKENQEVKNVMDQLAERRTRIIESLQNFRVIHKSSISLNNTSQISQVHEIAHILSTKEPKYSTSMGDEHPNITPKIESDEIIKSGVEELVPILSENEVTLEDKREDDFEDIEYVEASLSNLEIVSVAKENVVYQEEEEVNFEDISQIQDVILREKLLSINRLIANIESLNNNLTPDLVLNSSISSSISEESDNSLSDNLSPEFETFCDHTKETRSGNTTTHANDSLPEYDSFCFEIEPDQEKLIKPWDDPYVPHTHKGLLKWKYPEMNTVDFLLEVGNNNHPMLYLYKNGRKELVYGSRGAFRDPSPSVDIFSLCGKIIEC
nr:mRNA-capping enzyme-like isoform X2 [Tanacetum cinerariifolium]